MGGASFLILRGPIALAEVRGLGFPSSKIHSVLTQGKVTPSVILLLIADQAQKKSRVFLIALNPRFFFLHTYIQIPDL
jgi:hypothetical protein